MKRVIKFRVFDNISKEMYRWSQIASISLVDFYYEHYHLMQFTGLKDKNGIEIYEGDIVKIEFKEEFNSKNYINISEVIWSESSLRWDVPVENGAKYGLPLNWGGYESLEIIGNIHEHSNLLC